MKQTKGFSAFEGFAPRSFSWPIIVKCQSKILTAIAMETSCAHQVPFMIHRGRLNVKQLLPSSKRSYRDGLNVGYISTRLLILVLGVL